MFLTSRGAHSILAQAAGWTIAIPIGFDTAETALRQAGRFVERMREYLVEKGFWDESPE